MELGPHLLSISRSKRPRALISLENKFIAVSQSYCQLWNISRQQAEGSNLSKLRDDVGSCTEVWDQVNSQVINERDRHTLIHLLPSRDPNKSATTVSTDVFPSISDDGQLRGLEISENVIDQHMMRHHYEIATKALAIPGLHRLIDQVDWDRLNEPKLRDTLFWLSLGLSLKEMATILRITERGLAKRLELLRELTHSSSASMLRFWAIQKGFATFVPSKSLSQVSAYWVTAPRATKPAALDATQDALIA